MVKNSKYVEVAFQVLDELGGGPVPSKTLVDVIIEKGLLEDRKWLYHNVLQKVRGSELFDTSKRGFVSLASQNEAADNEEVNENQASEEMLAEEESSDNESPVKTFAASNAEPSF